MQVSGRAQVDAASQQLFGRQLSNQELASLTGAPAGSNVAVSAHGGRMEFSVTHPNIEAASRSLYRNAEGNLEIHNNIFTTKVTRTGFGSEMVGRQMERLEARREVHLDRCRTQRRSPGLHRLPRVAQDGLRRADPRERATEAEASNLPGNLRNATNVGQLHQSKAGTEWWEKHGDWIKVKFDTKPGSYSMKKMAKYQADRRKARGN